MGNIDYKYDQVAIVTEKEKKDLKAFICKNCRLVTYAKTKPMVGHCLSNKNHSWFPCGTYGTYPKRWICTKCKLRIDSSISPSNNNGIPCVNNGNHSFVLFK